MMQVEYQNPQASMPMTVPVLVLPNTAPEVIDEHVRENSAKDVPWLYESPADGSVAVICGGGPSLAEYVDQLRDMDGDIFALNGAAGYLAKHGVTPAYQVIVDAQQSSAAFVSPDAHETLLASAVHPDTLAAAKRPTLFHLNFADIEDLFPPEKVEAGGYTLIGGGVSVGITAMVLAYAMGYRKLHLYGYDSCNKGGATHAYDQPQNQLMPNIDVPWAGKTYNASMAMKLQAEAFLRFADQLKEAGCEIHVYGDGLLQAMYLQEPMSEREKYQKIWTDPQYRRLSPGEESAERFVRYVEPIEDDTIIDFGCGTGRGALAIRSLTGCRVIAVDFTDNCRDVEACTLPFLQHDLTQPISIRGDIGYCCDVMEHIPPADVEAVIRNIMASVPACWFQIATIPDNFGSTIGQKLHLTVQPVEWWADRFRALGFAVAHAEETSIHATLFIRTLSDRTN